TQKPEAALRHELAEIMFAEIDVVVRRDERGMRTFPNRRVVQTLARIKPGAVTRRGRRDERNESFFGCLHDVESTHQFGTDEVAAVNHCAELTECNVARQIL